MQNKFPFDIDIPFKWAVTHMPGNLSKRESFWLGIAACHIYCIGSVFPEDYDWKSITDTIRREHQLSDLAYLRHDEAIVVFDSIETTLSKITTIEVSANYPNIPSEKDYTALDTFWDMQMYVNEKLYNALNNL